MKSDLEKRIDNYFREGLDDLHVIPPADAWENIVGNLPAKRKSRKMFMWIATAACIGLFAAVSGWWFLQNQNSDKIENSKLAIQQGNKPIQHSTYNAVDKENQASTRKEVVSNGLEMQSKALTNPKANKIVIAEKGTAGNRVDKVEPTKIISNQKINETVTVLPSEVIKQNEFVSQPSSNNEQMAFLEGKQIRSLQQPFISRNIGGIKNIIVKKDSTPVYDDIFIADDEDKSKTDRWNIGGQMAPLYSYRNVTEVNAPGASKASMDQLEKAMLTYSSGVVVGYNASSRLSIHTGIYYMKMGEEMDNFSGSNLSVKSLLRNEALLEGLNTSGLNNSGVINSTGRIVTPRKELNDLQIVNAKNDYTIGKVAYQPMSIESKNVQQTFEFLEVPFLAKYKLLDRKFGIHLLGGVSTHVLVNNKTTIINSDNSKTTGKTENVQTFNYSSSVGFGMVYKLRKNMTFSVEPTFKYYLNSFNTSDEIKLHPFALGLYSGIFFKF